MINPQYNLIPTHQPINFILTILVTNQFNTLMNSDFTIHIQNESTDWKWLVWVGAARPKLFSFVDWDRFSKETWTSELSGKKSTRTTFWTLSFFSQKTFRVATKGNITNCASKETFDKLLGSIICDMEKELGKNTMMFSSRFIPLQMWSSRNSANYSPIRSLEIYFKWVLNADLTLLYAVSTSSGSSTYFQYFSLFSTSLRVMFFWLP